MFLGALIGAGSILAGLLVGFRSPNSLRKLMAYGVLLLELGIFIAILLVGLIYAWRKGALKWE
jgi:hypothetical protein